MTSHSSGCRARRTSAGAARVDRPEITHEAVDRFYSTIIKDSSMSSEDNAVIFGSRDNAGAGYPYKHAMIDIETMSTHPSNALVLSCALVPFAPERSDRLLLGRTYHWRFDSCRSWSPAGRSTRAPRTFGRISRWRLSSDCSKASS
jgi:hypothetical protein